MKRWKKENGDVLIKTWRKKASSSLASSKPFVLGILMPGTHTLCCYGSRLNQSQLKRAPSSFPLTDQIISSRQEETGHKKKNNNYIQTGDIHGPMCRQRVPKVLKGKVPRRMQNRGEKCLQDTVIAVPPAERT